MVKDTGAAAGPAALRSLGLPRPVAVAEGEAARPRSVGRGRAVLAVTAIEDAWRLDEEWWRGRPLSRLYYRVCLADGSRLTLFRDLVSGKWYRQEYDS